MIKKRKIVALIRYIYAYTISLYGRTYEQSIELLIIWLYNVDFIFILKFYFYSISFNLLRFLDLYRIRLMYIVKK